MAEKLMTSQERQRRRTIAGVSVVTVTSGVLAAVVGVSVLDGAASAVISGMLGMALGLLVGRPILSRLIAETLEPGSGGRSYVGIHAPDDDGGTARAGPSAG